MTSGIRRQVAMTATVTCLLAAALPSTASAGQKKCGPGLHAGKHTSCGLAKALLKKIGRDPENIADGVRVTVRSPATGKKYAFHLVRADDKSFTCQAQGDGTLSVRIDT